MPHPKYCSKILISLFAILIPSLLLASPVSRSAEPSSKYDHLKEQAEAARDHAKQEMVSLNEPEENDIAKLTGDDVEGTENELEVPDEKISIFELDPVTILLMEDLLRKGVLNATLGSDNLNEDFFEDFGGEDSIQSNLVAAELELLFKDPPPYLTIAQIIQARIWLEVAKANGYDELRHFDQEARQGLQNRSSELTNSNTNSPLDEINIGDTTAISFSGQAQSQNIRSASFAENVTRLGAGSNISALYQNSP